MTIFQDKLLTRTDCEEAGDYVVPNVISPSNLVFRPDIGHKLYYHRDYMNRDSFTVIPISAIIQKNLKVSY